MGKGSHKRSKSYPDPGAPCADDQGRPRSRPQNTKPARQKAQRAQSRSYNIPSVARTSDGAPQLPLRIGVMTVHALGRVSLERGYHTDRFIFPVGYEATRPFLSMRGAAEVPYTCTILRGEDVDGGSGPRFRITPSDDMANPITAETATAAWSIVAKAANMVRGRKNTQAISGPDYFGLGQNTIKHLLQELEGADRLPGYARQHFIEGGPFTAITTDIKSGLGGPSAEASRSGAGESSAVVKVEDAAVKFEDAAMKAEDVAMKVEDMAAKVEGDSGSSYADYVPKTES